ncbi:hypothetical protein DB30_04586 [Enhygromyxa salina]|uniref:Bulb-type lectin domain-containing protein n=1 Tax=Enhygromyxa salina TaxID=215803 RepID=A0A0C2D7I6_9BACT|nr:hypothetical protein DB30_04586 [Enhygromyxa salina]
MGVMLFSLALGGCGDAGSGEASDDPGETSISTGDGDGDPTGDGDGDPTGDGDGDPAGDGDPSGDGDGDPGGVKFDIGQDIDFGEGMPVDMCKVNDDGNAVGECEAQALPDSFEPNVEWMYMGNGNETQSVVTPMVGNLTDDDDNGVIDLCDIPDVVVVAYTGLNAPAHIHVLDGATGLPHYISPTTVDFSVAPALGDIDGDGEMELVTSSNGALVALDSDGTLLWTGGQWNGSYIGGVGLADLDNDGDVEIYGDNAVYDHTGTKLWESNSPIAQYPVTTAADLDDDGDLEIILGNSAYHHDGALMWYAPSASPGFPQVADFDDDGEPEILITSPAGLSMLETDGTVVYTGLTPTGDPASGLNWHRPAAVHDMDGDLMAEYAMSSRANYTVYEADASIVWSAPVLDSSGVAAGTAFDFLGDGIAEAMYADETNMYIYDGDGQVLLQTPRSSATGTEYPVVADIDNDGSAEIVVVSNNFGQNASPMVQAIGDIEDRWIQARRIWNQHAYHVTNVREDGVIPQWETPNWETFNTFRTNAQIEGGGACIPPPPG